jgi:hypothetical protein
VSVFYSENAPVGRLVEPRSLVLHIARDDALRAEGLAKVCVEELIAFLVARTLSESEWLVSCWNRHMTLQDSRLVEISVVVEAEIGLVVDAVKLSWPWLLGLVPSLAITGFFTAHT